jgi:CcmD family protein
LFEFLNQNSLFVVLTIALVVWLGIYLYLFQIDRKLKRLEKQTKK